MNKKDKISNIQKENCMELMETSHYRCYNVAPISY